MENVHLRVNQDFILEIRFNKKIVDFMDLRCVSCLFKKGHSGTTDWKRFLNKHTWRKIFIFDHLLENGKKNKYGILNLEIIKRKLFFILEQEITEG